jgi:hypothetical protein
MTTHQVPVIPANIPALRWENQFENRQNYMGNSSGLSKRNRCKRIYVPADSGVGYWEIIEFDKGFGMVINNANYHSKNILTPLGGIYLTRAVTRKSLQWQVPNVVDSW